MEENLEPTQVPVEPTEPTSPKAEPTEPVSPEPTEPVSGEKQPTPPITEGDVTKRLEEAKLEWQKEAEKDWQSRKDKELQPIKDELDVLKRTGEDAKLATLEERERAEFGDTKEVRDFQTTRRKLEDDRRVFDRDRLGQETLATQLNEQAKGIRAHQLATEKGVDVKELLSCATPEEMEVKATKIELEKVKAELAEKSKEPQEVDSGTPGASGKDLTKMSPDELIAEGIALRDRRKQ